VLQHLRKQWVDLSKVVTKNTVPNQLDTRVTLTNLFKKPHLEVGGTSVWSCNSIEDGAKKCLSLMEDDPSTGFYFFVHKLSDKRFLWCEKKECEATLRQRVKEIVPCLRNAVSPCFEPFYADWIAELENGLAPICVLFNEKSSIKNLPLMRKNPLHWLLRLVQQPTTTTTHLPSNNMPKEHSCPPTRFSIFTH
jgi:hypothetical protein